MSSLIQGGAREAACYISRTPEWPSADVFVTLLGVSNRLRCGAHGPESKQRLPEKASASDEVAK
eukprot:15383736-Alexandrium_andersonii.AAC.1